MNTEYCIFATCSIKNERPKIRKKVEINEFYRLKNMKVAKVFTDDAGRAKMLGMMDELNEHEDLGVACAGKNEFVVAAVDNGALAYVTIELRAKLGDCAIRVIK